MRFAAAKLTWPLVVVELAGRILLLAVVYFFGHDVFRNDVWTYFERANNIGWDFLPYRDFLWEYPPLLAAPLAIIPLVGRDEQLFAALFVSLMVAIEYAMLQLLRRSVSEHFWPITLLWSAAVVPLCGIAYFRLDLIPTFFAAVALVALLQRRSPVLPIVAGFLSKLWPSVMAVPLLIDRRWREVAAVVAGMGLSIGAWYAFSPEGFMQFLEFRTGDGFQIESVPGSLLLASGREAQFLFGALVVDDSGWEWVHLFMSFVLGGAALGAVWYGWRHEVDRIALTGGLVSLLILSTRLLSPQFLIWLAPFVALLFIRQRRLGYLYGVAVWLSLAVVEMYDSLLEVDPVPVGVVLLRNLVLVVLTVELFRFAFRKSRLLVVTPS